MSIRKVLGASNIQNFSLLSRELVFLALLGNVIDWPVAYIGIDWWMQSFAYRINLGLSLFIIGGGAVLSFVCLIASVYIFKAGRTGPITALRRE